MLELEHENFKIFSQSFHLKIRDLRLTEAPWDLLKVQSEPESSGDGILDLPLQCPLFAPGGLPGGV